jgi:Fusaric acid resistance protein family
LKATLLRAHQWQVCANSGHSLSARRTRQIDLFADVAVGAEIRRIWAAMMVALYATFWLQLESASSAAVTVGILALQTRGQAYEKAVYRVLAIGVVASFVIAGLFPQTRELFLIGFAGWLGLCVYAGGLLDGNRALAERAFVPATAVSAETTSHA